MFILIPILTRVNTIPIILFCVTLWYAQKVWGKSKNFLGRFFSLSSSLFLFFFFYWRLYIFTSKLMRAYFCTPQFNGHISNSVRLNLFAQCSLFRILLKLETKHKQQTKVLERVHAHTTSRRFHCSEEGNAWKWVWVFFKQKKKRETRRTCLLFRK